MLGALLLAESLPGGDQQRPPPASPATARVWKTEIKLLVTAENTVQAIRALKLDEHQAVKETVCYFDTSDGALAAKHLILRARQIAGQPGESTVKLLATAGATGLSDAERSIQPEQDWTNETEPTFSRSVDRKSLARGLVSKVAAGQAAVDELFNTAQRKLVAARMKEFTWESLRCYGPVEANVWQQQRKFEFFSDHVPRERFHNVFIGAGFEGFSDVLELGVGCHHHQGQLGV
jgi:hypothetical protein